MVYRSLSSQKALIFFLTGAMAVLTGCTSKNKNFAPDINQCIQALENAEKIPSMKQGSEQERLALQTFESFYEVYSAEIIQKGVRELYADDAWFADPFHVVQGIYEIEHYFLVMAEPVQECTFDVLSIQRSGDDYYARWTMKLVSEAAKDATIEAIGVSHVRFNAEGKVVFQQDYWDTSVMFDRLPVVGYWTRLVKGRIEKGLLK